jgi:hypothetical protein
MGTHLDGADAPIEYEPQHASTENCLGFTLSRPAGGSRCVPASPSECSKRMIPRYNAGLQGQTDTPRRRERADRIRLLLTAHFATFVSKIELNRVMGLWHLGGGVVPSSNQLHQ